MVCSVNVSRYRYIQIHLRTLESSRKATEVSLIIHEENTKKNHKRVVSSYVIEISMIFSTYTTYFLKITSLMNLL